MESSRSTLPLAQLVSDVLVAPGPSEQTRYLVLTCAGSAQCITGGSDRRSEARFILAETNATTIASLFRTAIVAARDDAARAAEMMGGVQAIWSLVEIASFGTSTTSYQVADGVKVEPPLLPDCSLRFQATVANTQNAWRAVLTSREGTMPTLTQSGKALVIDSLSLAGGLDQSLSPKARLLFSFSLVDDAVRARAELMRFFSMCAASR